MFRIDFQTILDANRWMAIYDCEYVLVAELQTRARRRDGKCSYVIHLQICAHEIRYDSVVGGSFAD